MTGSNILVGCVASACIRADPARMRRPQSHYVGRGMTTMVAGGVIPIISQDTVGIADNLAMLCDFIDMETKRPRRPVSDGADN